MAAMKRYVETEIKLEMNSAAAARRILRSAGFRLRKRRALESNVLYDTDDTSLRKAGQLLRLRTWGTRHLLTYKGPPERGRHKSREESETSVGDPSVIDNILKGLGLTPSFRYEKYRAEYNIADASGTASLDETPIGVFLELEGPPDWIDRTAARMGFEPRDYITASYATLYSEDCRRRGRNAADLMFDDSRIESGGTSKKDT